jgi:hypothetical protein
MLIYTSDNNNNILSQLFIDDLNKKHFWNCLFYLPNANITVRENKIKIKNKNLFFHRY